MSYKGIENNTISKPKARKKVTEPILTPLLRQKKKEVKALVTGQFFTWCTTTKNPEYEEGLKTLPFESCLIHNKCNKKNGEIKPLRIQTKPKYFTHLQRHKLTENCDFEVSDYHTDSFKAANYRKIKAMKKFGEFYQPLYEKKEVTLWFLTFTRAVADDNLSISDNSSINSIGSLCGNRFMISSLLNLSILFNLFIYCFQYIVC